MPAFAPVLLALSLAFGSQAHASAEPNLLLVGDSHTYGIFGKALDDLLREIPGARVKMAGSCGQTPFSFFSRHATHCGLRVRGENGRDRTWSSHPTPHINRLLRFSDRRGPDLTIIALGANHIGEATTKHGQNRIERGVDRIVRRVLSRGSECLWVGPPDSCKPTEALADLYESIEKAIDGRCRFMDNRPHARPYLDFDRIARERGHRGCRYVHLDQYGEIGREAGRRWASDVADIVESML